MPNAMKMTNEIEFACNERSKSHEICASSIANILKLQNKCKMRSSSEIKCGMEAMNEIGFAMETASEIKSVMNINN